MRPIYGALVALWLAVPTARSQSVITIGAPLTLTMTFNGVTCTVTTGGQCTFPAGQTLTFAGTWAANTAYAANSVLNYGGASYVAPAAFTSGSTFSTANLTLPAAAGAPGTNGAGFAVPVPWVANTAYTCSTTSICVVTNGGQAYYPSASVSASSAFSTSTWKLFVGTSDPTIPTTLEFGQATSGSNTCSNVLANGALPTGVDGMFCDNAGVWSYWNGSTFAPTVRSISGSGVSQDASGNVTITSTGSASSSSGMVLVADTKDGVSADGNYFQIVTTSGTLCSYQVAGLVGVTPASRPVIVADTKDGSTTDGSFFQITTENGTIRAFQLSGIQSAPTSFTVTDSATGATYSVGTVGGQPRTTLIQ